MHVCTPTGVGCIIVATIHSPQTQPVPNALSYFLHQSPAFMHKLETLGNHFVELVVSYVCMCRGGNACVCIQCRSQGCIEGGGGGGGGSSPPLGTVSPPPRIWQIHLYCYNSDDFDPPTFLIFPIRPPSLPIQNPGCSPVGVLQIACVMHRCFHLHLYI